MMRHRTRSGGTDAQDIETPGRALRPLAAPTGQLAPSPPWCDNAWTIWPSCSAQLSRSAAEITENRRAGWRLASTINAAKARREGTAQRPAPTVLERASFARQTRATSSPHLLQPVLRAPRSRSSRPPKRAAAAVGRG